jgi:hypothetical protein
MTHTLALEIDYAHENSGWMDCHLVIDGERHHMDATYVFPPFQPLLYFVRDVAGQRLPSKFFWDEEGRGVDFIATPVAEESLLMHLKLKHDRAELPWFDDVIERETVIQAFLPVLVDMAYNFFGHADGWTFPDEELTRVQGNISAGIPLRSEIEKPSPVEITVKGDYETQYVDGHVFINVTVNEYPTLFFLLHDTNPFWQEWVEFLGRIAAGDLHAQCEFQKSTTFHYPDQEPDEYRYWTRFEAEPLDHPHHFRLRIFTHSSFEEESLYVDEVLDRRAVVDGFASAFKKFLQDGYQLTPDHAGNTFDLRTLSLDKLS